MKIAGARFLRVWPSSSEESGRAEISWSSNSITVGWTPMVARSFLMTWHMQHEDRLKMITGCSEIRRWIRVSADSSKSIDKEEDMEMVEEEDAGTLRLTTSFEEWRRPCIQGGISTIKLNGGKTVK